MKRREFFCVDYMYTWNHNEAKDMYKEVRKAYPDNILHFEKSESGKYLYITVYDFVFVEEF